MIDKDVWWKLAFHYVTNIYGEFCSLQEYSLSFAYLPESINLRQTLFVGISWTEILRKLVKPLEFRSKAVFTWFSRVFMKFGKLPQVTSSTLRERVSPGSAVNAPNCSFCVKRSEKKCRFLSERRNPNSRLYQSPLHLAISPGKRTVFADFRPFVNSHQNLLRKWKTRTKYRENQLFGYSRSITMLKIVEHRGWSTGEILPTNVNFQ